MQKDSQQQLSELRVDGGAAANDLLMQFQADLLGVPVVRPKVLETTALGAAYLAGLTVDLWKSRDELASHWKAERRFEPRMADSERQAGCRAGGRPSHARAGGLKLTLPREEKHAALAVAVGAGVRQLRCRRSDQGALVWPGGISNRNAFGRCDPDRPVAQGAHQPGQGVGGEAHARGLHPHHPRALGPHRRSGGDWQEDRRDPGRAVRAAIRHEVRARVSGEAGDARHRRKRRRHHRAAEAGAK